MPQISTQLPRPARSFSRTAASRPAAEPSTRETDRVTLGELVSSGRIGKEELAARLEKALQSARLAPLSGLDEARLRRFTHDIPKVDLHRHLEGAITPESLSSVGQKHGVKLPTYDVEELRPLIQLTEKDKEASEAEGLKVFLSKFDLIGKIFTSPEVIEDISYRVVQDCHDDNLKYSELRFSPMYIATSGGKKPEEVTAEDLGQVTEAVLRGVEKASKDFGTRVGLIMIVERQMGADAAWVVERVAEKFKDKGVVALDLANNEYDFPPGPYREVFQAAKRAGLKITVHAGEVPIHHADKSIGGANNVRVAIEELGADRIGHGVKSCEDPAVERLVIERQIPLELCPTSNVQTQAVPSMEAHPLPHYYEAGAKVTVNNDDPGVSAITLSDDYYNISKTMGFSAQDLRRFVDNGVDAAFTTDAVKDEVRAEVQSEFAQAEARLFDSLSLEELQEMALQGAGSAENAARIRGEFGQLEEWLFH